MHLLAAAVLAVQAAFAPLLNSSDWIGTAPRAQSFTGKVVVVDVFTYSCINCKHVVPELRALRARHSSRDLTIVGIHTPELPFERVRTNVVQNLEVQGITWPVAVDNDGALWRAYRIQYWPTQLIFDRRGVLRKTVVGEGQDGAVAAEVAALVAER